MPLVSSSPLVTTSPELLQSAHNSPSPPPIFKRQEALPVAPLFELVKRRLPKAYHDAFSFLLQPGMAPVSGSTTNIYDAYKVTHVTGDDGHDKIQIEAATMSGLGAGLNHYLKEVCEVEMTWSSSDKFDETQLPLRPPTIPSPPRAEGQTPMLSGSSFVPWRYYMNVVTFGYSFAFWDWQRWERELDWMMLNGINMGLAMVGQEYVFRQFYLDLGLTDQEVVGEFLAGPAFTPWQRMGNMQGSWSNDDAASELEFKKRWYATQWALQQKMREFNITAVLPSFNGFVPRAMVKKHPQAKYEQASLWGGLPEQYTRDTYIPSTDPMFTTLSKQFIELQTKMYKGFTSHHYLLDLYNELVPPCETLECFTDVSRGVMHAMKAADPHAIWVMQGWFLVNRGYWGKPKMEAFFKGIKESNNGQDVFVFDLYSDVSPLWRESDGYYGLPWGWSMLNNFGGSQGLYGTLPTLLTEPFAGYEHVSKSMRGMGITMEGIHNNEYLYQLVLDLPWHRADHQTGALSSKDRSRELLNAFIRRRYGAKKATPAVLDAWHALSQSVWDCRTGQMSQSKTYLDKKPSLKMESEGFMGTKMWYDRKVVVEAWDNLIQALTLNAVLENSKNKKASTSPLRFDVVDVTREVLLGTILPALHSEIEGSYMADEDRLRFLSNTLLDVLSDTDKILATHSQFMLGPWLRSARLRAEDLGIEAHDHDAADVYQKSLAPAVQTAYADYLEYHARNQITWWNPKGQEGLQDYASKQWAGLVKTFYRPRWEIFFEHLMEATQTGEYWNETMYKHDSLERENVWQSQTQSTNRGWDGIETEEQGDTLVVAREIWQRWRLLAKRIAQGEGIW
ncbi:hypothetical protein BGW41_001154 [Actinomortierella wolfii]|nr:hypothetical protein BGW41_001154 [Actinomortierella wolfii]